MIGSGDLSLMATPGRNVGTIRDSAKGTCHMSFAQRLRANVMPALWCLQIALAAACTGCKEEKAGQPTLTRVWNAYQKAIANRSVKIWAAVESVPENSTNDVILFAEAKKSATQMSAILDFLEAVCLIENDDYAGANDILEDALMKWPGNIEFVFAKMVCLRATGSSTNSVGHIIDIAAQNESPYLRALVGAFNGNEAAKACEVSEGRNAFLAWLSEHGRQWTNRWGVVR